MVIYLKHDIHGTKVACTEAEAAADCSNGWQRFDPCPAVVAPVVEPEPAAEAEAKEVELSLNDLRELYADQFGTAPHHRKTAETLRKELGL